MDDDTDDDRDDTMDDDDDSDTTEYALTTGNSTFPSDNNNENENDAMNSNNSNNMFLPVFSIINVLLFRLSVVSSSLCLFHMFVDDRWSVCVRCFDDYCLISTGLVGWLVGWLVGCC